MAESKLKQAVIDEALKRYSGNDSTILTGTCLDVLIEIVEKHIDDQDMKIARLERDAHHHPGRV